MDEEGPRPWMCLRMLMWEPGPVLRAVLKEQGLGLCSQAVWFVSICSSKREWKESQKKKKMTFRK